MASLNDIAPAMRSRIAEDWVAGFNAALAAQDWPAAAAMIVADGYWRDLQAFGWKFSTCHGSAEIAAGLAARYDAAGCNGLRVDREPIIGQLGEFGETLEFFIAFETDLAIGRGYCRLVPQADAPGGFRALALLTAMQDLKQFPEKFRNQRREFVPAAPVRGMENWLDQRRRIAAFEDADPEVLIVGAGMAGLMMGARLGQLDIPTLLVNRTASIGQIWRERYHSLTFHNEICTNHMPYLPFPDTWPVYIPKDRAANWLEFYADALELNVWNSTEFLGAEWHEADKRWTARLRLADGSIRTMRPGHIVMAAGVSGLPNIPAFPGLDSFKGPVVHSSGRSDDVAVEGRNVLVVGTGTSAHDIAQDLYLRGGNVTMLQRSPVTVVSLEPASIRPFGLYKDNEGKLPIAEIDMMAAGVPIHLLRRLHQKLSRVMMEDDKELLDALHRIGFETDNGEDDAGYFLKLLRTQGGYYINVGCSDLLIEGKIGLRKGGIDHITENEVVLTDGSHMKVDVLVLGTGYKPMQESVRTLFGAEMADRVGPVWGLTEDMEQSNMYSRTNQEGLYFTGGGFMGARAFSHYTARLIKARIEGLIPDEGAAGRRVAVEA